MVSSNYHRTPPVCTIMKRLKLLYMMVLILIIENHSHDYRIYTHTRIDLIIQLTNLLLQ